MPTSPCSSAKKPTSCRVPTTPATTSPTRAANRWPTSKARASDRPGYRSRSAPRGAFLLAGVGALELLDVELFHAHHRLHGALSGGLVVAGDHLHDDGRHHLPRQAVAVLQPAALLRRRVAALGQTIPVMVDLVLRLAIDLERDGRRELEFRPGVERRERLPVERKRNGQHAGRPLEVALGVLLAVARHLAYPGRGEDVRIKLHRRLGLAVEPQAGRDFLQAFHARSPGSD